MFLLVLFWYNGHSSCVDESSCENAVFCDVLSHGYHCLRRDFWRQRFQNVLWLECLTHFWHTVSHYCVHACDCVLCVYLLFFFAVYMSCKRLYGQSGSWHSKSRCDQKRVGWFQEGRWRRDGGDGEEKGYMRLQRGTRWRWMQYMGDLDDLWMDKWMKRWPDFCFWMREGEGGAKWFL